MGRVMYDGKRLIPAPYVQIEKIYDKLNNGEIVGSTFNITLIGQTVAYKGSPTATGTFWQSSGYPADESIAIDSRLGAILAKQAALRDLFSREGMQLEIQSDDGSAPTKCNPRVVSLSFPDGPWHTLAPYSVQLQADRLYPQDEDSDTLPSGYFISDASETWQLETDETGEGIGLPRTYRITHSISAQGKRTYDDVGGLPRQPWENAREFVLSRLGLDNYFISSSGVNDLPSYYGGYNHVRNESTDELAGNYSVVETWILTSGTALEDFTVNSTYSLQDAITRVTVDGSITGLEQRNSEMGLVTSKYSNALTKWTAVQSDLLLRAQSYTGLTLNVSALTETVGRNPVAGTISYSYEYNTRPSTVLTDALTENITITEQGYSQRFAAISVLGRTRGPVLQDIGTSDAISRTLSIDAVYAPTQIDVSNYTTIQNTLLKNPRLNPTTSAVIEKIIAAVNPLNQGASRSYKSQPQENWNAIAGTYSYNVTYTYEW